LYIQMSAGKATGRGELVCCDADPAAMLAPSGIGNTRLDENAASVGARSLYPTRRNRLARPHGRSGVGEFDPLALGHKKRNSVSVSHMAKEAAGHLLAADLVPIVIDRHQQKRGEGVCFFFTLFLCVFPAVGLQRKALEVEIARELAV